MIGRATTLRAVVDRTGPHLWQTAGMATTSTRLLQLLTLLTTRSWWSAAELAERLGVTTRTVRRDVDRLRGLDYPVESVRGPAGGYRLGGGGRLPPLLLDQDEAVAVAVCLRAGASGSVIGVEEAAARALAKLEQTLPPRLRPRVAAVEAATLALTPGVASVDPEILLRVAQACREAERLRFEYRARDGVESRRLTEPYRLVHAGRHWYLVARDVDRDAWRTFRLDRISRPHSTFEHFRLEDPPDARELVSRAVSTAAYRHEARVRFRAAVAEVAELVPPTVGMLVAEGDDATVLTTGADHLEWIAVHLALTGLEFEVLHPPELRDAVQAVADRLHRAAARTAL